MASFLAGFHFTQHGQHSTPLLHQTLNQTHTHTAHRTLPLSTHHPSQTAPADGSHPLPRPVPQAEQEAMISAARSESMKAVQVQKSKIDAETSAMSSKRKAGAYTRPILNST